MGVKPLFNRSQIEKQLEEKRKPVEGAIVLRLRMVGLEFVKNARINADFTDRTGNLRSSIGFIILKDGKVIEEDFEQAAKGTDRASGYRKGLDFAKKEAKGLMKGFAIIVVAGMEYAAAVESKGFDVLTGSSIIAGQALKKSLEELKNKLSK